MRWDGWWVGGSDWIGFWGRKGVGLGVRGRGRGEVERSGWMRLGSDGKGEVGVMEKKKVCEDQISGIIKL